MLNLNFIDTINVFSKEKEILGYKCIYKEHAIFRDNNIINTRIELKNHSQWVYLGDMMAQVHYKLLWQFCVILQKMMSFL